MTVKLNWPYYIFTNNHGKYDSQHMLKTFLQTFKITSLNCREDHRRRWSIHSITDHTDSVRFRRRPETTTRYSAEYYAKYDASLERWIATNIHECYTMSLYSNINEYWTLESPILIIWPMTYGAVSAYTSRHYTTKEMTKDGRHLTLQSADASTRVSVVCPLLAIVVWSAAGADRMTSVTIATTSSRKVSDLAKNIDGMMMSSWDKCVVCFKRWTAVRCCRLLLDIPLFTLCGHFILGSTFPAVKQIYVSHIRHCSGKSN